MTWWAWPALIAGTYILVLAALDVFDQWRHRRRPVRGPDGRWRAPRRPDGGWGRR